MKRHFSLPIFRQPRWLRIVYFSVLGSMSLAVCYVAHVLGGGRPLPLPGEQAEKTDYTLMLVECLMGIVVIHVPEFFKGVMKLKIPPALRGLYYGFLFCAIFLGEVFFFYYAVPHWDDLLHASSSLMTGLFACMLLVRYHRGEPPAAGMVVLFALCFSMAVGGIWEIYEYCFDCGLQLNMQKYLLRDGTALVGQAALTDTMKDLIVDFCGACFSGLYAGIALHRPKSWLARGLGGGEKE